MGHSLGGAPSLADFNTGWGLNKAGGPSTWALPTDTPVETQAPGRAILSEKHKAAHGQPLPSHFTLMMATRDRHNGTSYWS